MLVAFAAAFGSAYAQTPQIAIDQTDLGVPFQRITTSDSLGRSITFYLSKAPTNAKLPVALWVQGSGCQSLFSKQGDKVGVGLHGVLLRASEGKIRVLAVEKPGVKFQDVVTRPGTAEGASEQFLKEHTLPRWAEANVAALRATWTIPGIDTSRTLVIGHSEGGIVAARVAAELPQVTHVASLAGGGPTQLFSFAELDGQFRTGDSPDAAPARRQAVFDEWTRIQADPESTTKFWRSHPYNRWSTFMASSLIEELLRSKARVYLVHGVNDPSTPVTAFDVARSELAVRNRDVMAERLEHADHGFRTDDMPKGSPDGMKLVFGRVLDWFLANVSTGK